MTIRCGNSLGWHAVVYGIALAVFACQASVASTLSEKAWIHGSENCADNRDPPLEVFSFDASTYILRQNKCVHFEAPFIYVMFGEHTVFVQDTGATEDAGKFPLYDTVQQLVKQRGDAQLEILVTHSHSHGDHKAADVQFRGKPGVTLVEANAVAVREYFGFTRWPAGAATIDLGGRQLTVLPAPGHQDESLVVYDAQTGWLLTGDSVYPGRLYVWDWDAFRASVRRMAEFANTHPVSAVMGTHIELSRTGEQFPIGSTFQPGEAPLPLSRQDLLQLDQSLQQAGDTPKEITTKKFVVSPISTFQRIVSGIMKALGMR